MKDRFRHIPLVMPLLLLAACSASERPPAAAASAANHSPTDAPVQAVLPPNEAIPERESSPRAEELARSFQASAGDMKIAVTASQCRAVIRTLASCSGTVTIEIAWAQQSPPQTISATALFVDPTKLIYRGPLTESKRPETHTFVISDVNGDGSEDLLVWSGKDGAYGGPSFDVYLYDVSRSAFAYSQAFSDLTVGYAGLFTVEDGKIKVSSVDGCCLHMHETYAIKQNVPELVERVTEDSTAGVQRPKVTTERLVDGKLMKVPAGE